MSEKNDGGPVFPLFRPEDTSNAVLAIYGISLRDWFAGLSMMSRRSNPNLPQGEITAEECYGDADAMLKEREK